MRRKTYLYKKFGNDMDDKLFMTDEDIQVALESGWKEDPTEAEQASKDEKGKEAEMSEKESTLEREDIGESNDPPSEGSGATTMEEPKKVPGRLKKGK